MLISEIFGYGVDNQSEEAWNSRLQKRCPFRDSPCTKSSKTDPIGICSLSDGERAAAVCPVRFVEDDKIFKDAASLAFSPGSEFGVFPEVRILKIEPEEEAGRGKAEAVRKIGKVDYLLGKIENGKVVDFCAVEVQAVYFSGTTIRPPLQYFMENRKLDLANSDRRPDFRSSAQKRLVPQLQLKVPVFRRWGKKFFVVVDSQFFGELPSFNSTTAANSEVTWLSYSLAKTDNDYKLSDLEVIHSEWDEIRNALREGTPPDPEEIFAELQLKLDKGRVKPKVIKI